MVKRYCDICNREIKTATEYILPKIVPVYTTDRNGNKITVFGKSFEPEKKELCSSCEDILNSFVDRYLPVLSMGNDGSLLINIITNEMKK